MTRKLSDTARRSAEAVFAGLVPMPDEGEGDDFYYLTMEQLVGDIWTRPSLSMRDKRLVLLGALAALGVPHKYAIHVAAAVKNGELSPAEARELPIFLTHYVGQPFASDIRAPTEDAIAKFGPDSA